MLARRHYLRGEKLGTSGPPERRNSQEDISLTFRHNKESGDIMIVEEAETSDILQKTQGERPSGSFLDVGGPIKEPEEFRYFLPAALGLRDIWRYLTKRVR